MFGIGLTFGAEMFYRFRGLHVCRFGACPFDHIDEGLGIFQHRAGAEVIMVEGLSFGIFLEQGLLETGDEVLVVDVGAGVVDEDARFDVAVGIDMAIIAAAATQPSMNWPSFWKSMANIGLPPLTLRISRMRRTI